MVKELTDAVAGSCVGSSIDSEQFSEKKLEERNGRLFSVWQKCKILIVFLFLNNFTLFKFGNTVM